MFSGRTSVGLDVHARSVVAHAVDWETGRHVAQRLVPVDAGVVAWVARLAQPVAVAYEAGPTGFGLARAFAAAGGAVCGGGAVEVGAAARGSGENRSARRRPAGPPGAYRGAARGDGAVRGAGGCSGSGPGAGGRAGRSDAARHRCSKLLLRHGIVYYGGQPWNGPHERWLAAQRFDRSGVQIAFDEALDAVWATTGRRERLDTAVETMAAEPQWSPVVGRLACVRGVATLTAFGLAVEIGDWERFTGATIGAYLGLVPSESSSGSRRSQGAITKAGNTHARRLLVEAAWQHQRPLRSANTAVRGRRKTATPAVRARGEAADRRLHQRWMTFTARGKTGNVAAVAVARELAGWCWSLATMTE